MFDHFAVAPPNRPYDFIALRETYRGVLNSLDMESMAMYYGISALEIGRDEAFCEQVEDWLASWSDPVLARYEFAYNLAAYFGELYAIWNSNKPDEPDYVGTLPDWVYDKTMAWLLAGIAKFRDDRDLIQNVHWLRYRSMVYDTYLREDTHIPILEEALGYEIRSEDDPYVKESHARLREAFEKMRNDRDSEEGQTA